MSAKNSADYRNRDLQVSERVSDLLSKMTLEQKIFQMHCVWENKKTYFLDEEGDFDEQKADRYLKQGFGQIGRPSDSGKGKNAREMAELTNTIQKYFIEKSELGIPVIFHEECLHGLATIDATHFPQPIGLAATFDPDLITRIFQTVAEEAVSRGVHQTFNPVLDVARDPRWGRVEETFGEDPFLVAQMGVAVVKGLQGDSNFSDKKHLIATLKHFAAHGQPESGTNCAPVNVSERILREIFLYPFKTVIETVDIHSVMASFNEIDGVPSHANKWLLRDTLRNEWGFDGYVVSDYHAILELDDREDCYSHSLAKNRAEAATLAVKAGVNIELPEPECYPHLLDLVKSGVIEEKEIDELIAPMLEYKFRLGLFDDPYVDPDYAEQISGCESNRKIALESALETITLLKNENSLAPLDINKINSIAVIGPNADRVLLGGYSAEPKYYTTVLEGIRQKVGDRMNVLYSEGCKITVGGSWWDDEVVLSDPDEDRKQIQESVAVAQKADVVVLAIGGNEQTSREAFFNAHLGDRTSLELVGRQNDLVKAILETGKPVIVFLFNGRPLSINYINENVPTIFECWYLGQETGNAVAEVLFGDYNPSGKLPITIPRSVGHIPAYYNHKPSARRGYLFDDVSPLFAFGFGLNYTTFEIDEIHLVKPVIKPDETTQLHLKITNTGKFDGDEVVQMYIHDMHSSVTRPVKELKGFKRIHLKAGKTKSVSFEIKPELLSFYDINMEYRVEAGDFEIMVGSSSRDEDLLKTILKVEQ